ncbi:MAG: ATP-binding cassette domain-containing protein [Gammaproteobacteria bacterium]|nr:MAG: ATP-binding cassette domain-containing protein [Gammaproteobacteria bacterium]
MNDLLVERLERPGLAPVEGLAVPTGQTLCLHGPSGSGKTLLLRAIADLDPNQGVVRLGHLRRDEVSAPEWRRRVIYVPPESDWWEERVASHAPQWPPEWLSRLDLEPEILQQPIRQLSTGERQRLAIVRALARRPAALLLDEPTANLDEENTRRVEGLLQNYQRQTNAPLLWVSHDPAQRERVADQSRAIVAGRLA